MSSDPRFYYFNDALLNMGAISSASELQGYFCGKLSGMKTAPESLPGNWTDSIKAFMDMEFLEFSSEHERLLGELFLVSKQQLNDAEFSFRPLLPEEESGIERRTQELAAWCRGFLHGLGSSGLQAQDKLSAESAEALRDLAKISQVSLDEVIDGNMDREVREDLEADWESLVEYVKIAVLTINQECGENVTRVH